MDKIARPVAMISDWRHVSLFSHFSSTTSARQHVSTSARTSARQHVSTGAFILLHLLRRVQNE